MLNFFQNQWVVGIGAGIVSGFIVFFVSKLFLRRKDRSEHMKLIEIANTELLNSLKPYVAEKGLPEYGIVNAVIISVAREYKVKMEELFSIRVICEELIREIIGNAYVSSDLKDEYSIQLIKYLENLDAQHDKAFLITDIEKEMRNNYTALKQEYIKRISLILSIVGSISAALATMFTIIQNNNTYSQAAEIIGLGDIDTTTLSSLSPTLIGVFSTLVVSLAIVLIAIQILRKNKHKR